MKNIGIHFHEPETQNIFTTSILPLLELFDFKNYMWRIVDNEVYLLDENSENTFNNSNSPFNEAVIDGSNLEQLIKDKNCYIIFLTLYAFPKKLKGDLPLTWIHTAADFINSDCEFLLSIVDTYDISILSKNPKLLTELFTHVKNLGYVDVKYLNESNSGTF